MRDDVKNALIKFENKHFSAVQTDTELGLCDNDARYVSLERKAKQFWADCKAARDELTALLEKIA